MVRECPILGHNMEALAKEKRYFLKGSCNYWALSEDTYHFLAAFPFSVPILRSCALCFRYMRGGRGVAFKVKATVDSRT